MPIPTDTFWNIKKLNWVFALSAIALVLSTGWSIMQDYNKSWRRSQQDARVWEAALTHQKIDAYQDDAQREEMLKSIDQQLTQAEAELAPKREQIAKLENEIRALASQRQTREFKLNNDKSTLGVMETEYQDALAAKDEERIKRYQSEIGKPRREVQSAIESLASDVLTPLENKKVQLREATAQRDELEGRKKKLRADQEALQKKLAGLNPPSIVGKLSAQMRNFPLLDFVNPSEKIDQRVLPDVQTDVAFMKITTIDRCVTCHVNIANKDYTKERVQRYLETEAMNARKYSLPELASTDRAGGAATKTAPGAAAMPDFWYAWARTAAPDALRRNAVRLGLVIAVTGKGATIKYDGQPVPSFKFNPALLDPKAPPSTAPTSGPSIDAHAQDDILLALIDALLKSRVESNKSVVASTADRGKAHVEIPATTDATVLAKSRDVAIRYIEELQRGLQTALKPDQLDLLQDRYRYALIDVVNPARAKEGWGKLNASPALLAHPRLDLYVDVDSKHPMDSGEKKIGVGCTSCHDGSGQETDFVLAAHTAREIMVDRRTGVPVPSALLPASAGHEDTDRATMASMMKTVAPEHDAVPKGISDIHIKLNDGHGEHGEHDAAAPHVDHGADPPPIDYTDPVTGKASKAVTQMAYWRAKYEPEAPRSFALVYHEWDWPMRPPKFLEANCARCHSSILEIKDDAPTLFEGRQLFAQLGCVNCHQMQSIPPEDKPSDAAGMDPALVMSNNRVKVGPSLTHVASKLSPDFIHTWIWAPKAFRPTTKMPHFFMLENNSSDEELRRTRQEARAITEYLVQMSDPLPPAHQIGGGLKGSADAGKTVFNSIGCMSCHANLNDPQPEKRNNKPVTLGEKWIVADLIKANAMKKEDAEKTYDAMSYNERQTYVKENFEQEPGQRQDQLEKYTDGTPKPIFVHVGPELSGIGTKLTAGKSVDEARQWLFDWVKEPRHYSAYTIMPRLRLSDQQAIDLAEYLLAQKRTTDSPNDTWSAGLAEVDSEKQRELTALFLRSKYSAQTALARADDDAELTALAADAVKRTTATPAEDKIALAEAQQRVAQLNKDEKRMLWLGKKLISHYGCMSCHAIKGTEKLTAPGADLSDWGQKGIDKLGFDYLDPHKVEHLPPKRPIPMVNGLSADAANLAHTDIKSKPVAAPVEAGWPHVEHVRADWLQHKLKNTRIYDRGKELLDPDPSADDIVIQSGKPYDKLKMPTFYLNDEQVHQIVTFVISNRFIKGDRLISESLRAQTNTPRAMLIARGRELTTKFNCVSCHWIENNAPQIQQYYKPDELLTKAPPPIRGEGNKVQHSWLFNFFRNVTDLRPLLYQHNGIRMPSFPATDDEWAAIIAYFNAVSNHEAELLQSKLGLAIKYVDAERAKAAAVADAKLPDAKLTWPGDDWWRKDDYRPAGEFLKRWALDTKNLTDIEFDPTKNSAVEMDRAYRRAMFKARFTLALYTAPYPFVESGQPLAMTEERYKLGEEFFNQMQCLSCHYLGDPNAAGAVKEPKAPNLSLTYQRLQRRWVRHWTQEPPVIQPGTSMPAFFSGLPVFNLHGQTWSETASRPQPEIEFFNNRYGKTADEQATLVLDYLYAAGAHGVTSVQIPIASLPQPPGATTGPSTGPAGDQPKGNEAAHSPASTQPALEAKPGEPTSKPEAPPRAPRVQPNSPLGAPTTGPATQPSARGGLTPSSVVIVRAAKNLDDPDAHERSRFFASLRTTAVQAPPSPVSIVILSAAKNLNQRHALDTVRSFAALRMTDGRAAAGTLATAQPTPCIQSNCDETDAPRSNRGRFNPHLGSVS